MNWKSILKVLGIGLAIGILIVVGLGVWGLSKLPSAFEIKQSVTPPALKQSSASATKADETSSATSKDLPEKANDENPSTSNHQTTDEKLKQEAYKVLLEDFSDQRKPLLEACRNLAKAPESGFLKDKKNASGKYFIHALSQEERDPLSETAAPPLRMIFRAPGMQQILDMVLKSEETKDPGIVKKAEFYYEIYRAGSYLKEHVGDLNRIMQQSYNLHNLMKAVAAKPELAQSPQALSYCEDLEKSLNNDDSFDADQASRDMMDFLNNNGIKPGDIDYDPNYRSKVNLNISNTQLNVSDAWIAKIFAADIEKAMKEKAQK